jgi:fatty-acyl-CoA synthase
MTVEDAHTRQGSIGRPVMFTEIRLSDENGNEVVTGEIGEMWIRGPHVSNGYWNNPAATAEAYVEGGWFRTGDLARRDSDGFFYIAGRRKDMFISGGVNVYPAEVEAELVQHPRVRDAAVIGVPDPKWGEVGVAFVVANDVDASDLEAFLAGRLARYKVPRTFVFIDALPRTPYGKVLKEELRKQLG